MADAEPADAQRGRRVVLLVGGLLTDWWWYLPVARRLERRHAVRVRIARLWWWHWLAAGFVGPAHAATIVSSAIDRLHLEAGRPILVVGHSAGGILARLALARVSYRGTRLAGRSGVGALVTLGTPHQATDFGGTLGRHGLKAIRFLRALERRPGPQDTIRTLSVSSRLIDDPPAAHEPRSPRQAFSATCYKALVGATGATWRGDGLVPQDIASLPKRRGRRRRRLVGFAHAPLLGAPWYLGARGIEAWWSEALDLWHPDDAAHLQSRA